MPRPCLLIAAILAGMFLAADVSAQEAPPAANGPPAIRVMSFNIRYGTAKDGANSWVHRKEFLARTISAFEPDLLGTQETLADQRDFLAATLPGYEAFGVGRDNGRDEGEMAALFFRTARFEKLDGGHFWLSESPDKVGSKGWDAALPRIATWVKLKDRRDPAAAPIFFLNTHFDHIGERARAESARLIVAMLRRMGKNCRIIVTGDFNAGEGSGPYKSLFETGSDNALLRDTYREVHPPYRVENEGTFNGFDPKATGGDRIDWIACSAHWEVRQAEIDRTTSAGRTPSDHFPVTAVLRPAQATPTLRVVSYNIHHGEGTDGKIELPRLAKVLRAADPDLVALQEVDKNTRRTGGVDQTAELAALTGMHGAFGKAIDFEGGEYGQAILSRFPIRTSAIHKLPGDPDREQRIAFEVRVDAGGHELAFVSTHLHHQSEDFRVRQATRLNEILTGSDRPVILAGDLNATPASKPLQAFADWTIAGAGLPLPTYPSKSPTAQIDYVLMRPRPAFRVIHAAVIDEPVASDHRPVLVDLAPLAK